MPPQTPKAWAYFRRMADLKSVKFKLEVSYTGGTTNMLNNSKRKPNSEARDLLDTPQNNMQLRAMF